MKTLPNPFQAIIQSHYSNRLQRQLTDKDRLQAVYSSRFWNSPEHDKLRQFCNTAALMLECPHAHISLVTDSVQRIVAANEAYAAIEGKDEELPDFSVCQHVVGFEDALPINDMNAEPTVCHVNVVTEGGMKAYLGVPLMSRDQIIGAFCVLDEKEREWTDIDVTALAQLASALVSMHEVGAL